MDAAFAFLTSQLTHIESKVFEVEYPLITYSDIVPVSTEAGEGATSVTYYTIDRVGMAKWIAADAGDIPLVDVKSHKSVIPVELGAVGYSYNLEEIRQAQRTKTNLEQLKANAAREAYEEMADRVAFLGDSAKGLPGFLTNALVPRADALDPAGTATFDWDTKTADEIVYDINAALTDVYETTKNRHIPSHVLLPPSFFAIITSMRIGADANKTVLEYVKENNIYTSTTGNALEIKPCRYLEKFPDTPSTFSRRMVVYTPSTDVVVYHIPKILSFYAPQAKGFNFEIPGDFKLGGVEIRKPLTMKFVKIGAEKV